MIPATFMMEIFPNAVNDKKPFTFVHTINTVASSSLWMASCPLFYESYGKIVPVMISWTLVEFSLLAWNNTHTGDFLPYL